MVAKKILTALSILVIGAVLKFSFSKKKLILHIVPYGYEGPLLEAIDKNGNKLIEKGDTIFVKYGDNGFIAYNDTITHGKKNQIEKYFYHLNGKILGEELKIDKKQISYGSCTIESKKFYSVIVRSKNFTTSFRETQWQMIERFVCGDLDNSDAKLRKDTIEL